MKVMSGLFISALFLTAFLLQGCTTTNNAQVVCTKPYILVGTSCCLDENNNGICDKDEQSQSPVVNPIPTPTPTPAPTPTTEYTLVQGDKITVGGKTLTLVDFSIFQGMLDTVVDVDGVTRDIYETNKPEIINGLRVTPINVDRLQTQVTLDVRPFTLGPDEYLLEMNAGQVILGKTLVLREVQDDNGILVELTELEKGNVFVMPGDTKQIDGVKITNVESFYRSGHGERYAVVKVVFA